MQTEIFKKLSECGIVFGIEYLDAGDIQLNCAHYYKVFNANKNDILLELGNMAARTYPASTFKKWWEEQQEKNYAN